MIRTIKSTFLLLLVSFVSFNTMAQDDDRAFRLGFKIIPGFDWTKANTSNVVKNGSAIGFSFGLMADIHLDRNYYFTPELNITTINCNIKRKDNEIMTLKNDSFNNANYKYNLKYLEIPLSFKFKTLSNNGMRYWGQIGVAPGILIGNQVTASAKSLDGSVFPMTDKYNPNKNENDNLDFDQFKDNINSLRASMILGLGIEYELSSTTSFYAGLRFNNGFTDILGDKKASMINNVIGLELGFFF